MLEEMCARVDAIRLADDFTPDPNPVFWAHGHRSMRVVLPRSRVQHEPAPGARWQRGAMT